MVSSVHPSLWLTRLQQAACPCAWLFQLCRVCCYVLACRRLRRWSLCHDPATISHLWEERPAHRARVRSHLTFYDHRNLSRFDRDSIDRENFFSLFPQGPRLSVRENFLAKQQLHTPFFLVVSLKFLYLFSVSLPHDRSLTDSDSFSPFLYPSNPFLPLPSCVQAWFPFRIFVDLSLKCIPLRFE